MTIAQVRADLMKSKERKQLEDRKAAEYAKKEWVRNLKPYVTGDNSYVKPTKLAVVPAAGVTVTNLETGDNLNSTIVPKGTQVDIVAKTTAKAKSTTYHLTPKLGVWHMVF